MSSSEKPRIAILASGSGTTAETLLWDVYEGRVDADVPLVISNNEDAGVFDKVDRFNALGMGIEKRFIRDPDQPRGDQTPQEAFRILREIITADVSLVLLLGYMKRVVSPLLPPERLGPNEPLEVVSSLPNIGDIPLDQPLPADVIEAIKHQHPYVMLNNHPSITRLTLGKIGKKAQEKILEIGHPFSAATTHFVEADYDTGEVYREHLVPVMPDDDADTLFAAVQSAEKANIGPDVQTFIKEHLAAELAARRR